MNGRFEVAKKRMPMTGVAARRPIRSSELTIQPEETSRAGPTIISTYTASSHSSLSRDRLPVTFHKCFV